VTEDLKHSSETSVTFYHLTYCHITKVLNLHEHYSENLKSKSKDHLTFETQFNIMYDTQL